MAKIEAAIKEAILRGARKQIRVVATPLRREVRRLRRVVGQVRREMKGLRDVASQWRRQIQTAPWLEVSERELKAARLSPRLIQKLRARLGLARAALARLVGVSPGAVVQWEHGGAAPSDPNRKHLVALRKLGRREVKRLLASLRKPSPGGRARARGRHRRGRRRPRQRT